MQAWIQAGAQEQQASVGSAKAPSVHERVSATRPPEEQREISGRVRASGQQPGQALRPISSFPYGLGISKTSHQESLPQQEGRTDGGQGH